MKKYEPKDFSHLIGMAGFSKQLLENHFKLYQAYVENTNKLQDHLKTLLQENRLETPEFAEIKRRFGWEFDGMRLHEFYFGNLGGKSSPPKQADFFKQLKPHWESFEKWETDFRATGEIRGIGWGILYRDPITGFFFNAWINEHDVGHFAGCTPILVMDVWEHAFMLDYGTKKDAYIDAFIKNINWEVVDQRLSSEQPLPFLEKEFATPRK
jgi:superoxide dismutase, Fe-Mn family